MATASHTKQIDDAAFGVVYGSVSVMAVLMAMHPPIEDPGRAALTLFATVFVVALAKAFAEACEQMLRSGEPVTVAGLATVWRHSRTVLLAANGPTAAFALSALGLLDPDTAYRIAQWLALALLAYFGGRIGWRVRGTITATFAGAAVTCGLGLFISALKLLVH